MERIATNATGKVRTEILHGREYFVAPATSLQQQVLNGSEGSLFYPEAEIAKAPGMWNGMPITKDHPQIGGEFVSARRPDVLNDVGIGWVFNTVYNSALTHELWFDKELTKKVDRRIYDALDAGRSMELSTGLFTEQSAASGEYNGKPYTAIATNYRPDHIAILMDDKGACSNADGCGVLVNAETIQGVAEALASRVMPGYGQTFVRDGDVWYVGGDSDVPEFVDEVKTRLAPFGVVTYEAETFPDETWTQVWPVEEVEVSNVFRRVWNYLTQPRSKNTGKYKPYGAGTGKGPVFEAAQHGALNITDEHRTLGLQAGTEIAAGAKTPSFADAPIWEKAVAASARCGEGENWAYICAVYLNMGGQIAMDRKTVINWLVTNCECWKGKDGAEVLNKFDDGRLKGLKTIAENSAKMDLIANRLKKNADGEGEVAGVDLAALADFLGVTIDAKADPVGFVSDLKAKLDEVQLKLGGAAPAAPVEPDADEMPMNEEKKKEEEVPATNRRMTKAEFEAQMPKEYLEVWNQAKEVESNERKKLVQLLCANISDTKRRQERAKRFNAMSIPDLRELVEDMGVPAFDGAQGGPRAVTANVEEGDLLPVPGE